MQAHSCRVRLIAPSGYPHDREAALRGVTRLYDAGCLVDGLEVLDRIDLRYAGKDAQRIMDINDLATLDELPDIVLAIRGGYGVTRLLEHLRYEALRERLAGQPIALVGHSDFTALQMALYAKCGLVTFGGPMLGPDFGAQRLSPLTWRHFWRTLSSPHGNASWDCGEATELDLQGPLWGGNLAMVCSLLETPYFPQIEGGILFVEDIGEAPFRVERMLYQLHLSGVLKRQRALILGDFTQCRPAAYDNGYELADAILQIRRVAGIPVLSGMPFGHEADKFTLAFGVPARLRVVGQRATLDFHGYPHLRQPHEPSMG
ncbi:muramoyltetrapeptide carboxypeptidase [Dyella monticola]|uniref:Muramoyltetrapeptide carboxypeptidase n=1 Tax=Dyella monticola TaxID=1927958 RepID=A0A370X3M5_9GAMM|nr:muramoyltetrapeptide carboxypeptidase [Dyella monticola]RDS83009.1 muramoyltetrapeptide carboxypeptidase [Dyella monticola]